MNIENIKNYTPSQLNKKITYINQFTDDQEFIADCYYLTYEQLFKRYRISVLYDPKYNNIYIIDKWKTDLYLEQWPRYIVILKGSSLEEDLKGTIWESLIKRS